MSRPRTVEEAWSKSPEYRLISELTMHSLLMYVNTGRPVGDFLTAVFENDLMTAVAHADGANIKVIREICLYVHNHTPKDCHGSKEKVDAWIEAGGIDGQLKAS